MFTVALDRIKPNPWQTRSGYDPEYIRELALDIASRVKARPATRGLLQVPLARIVDADGQPVTTYTTTHGSEIPFNDGSIRDLNMSRLLEQHDLYVQLAFGHNRVEAFRLLSGNGDLSPISPIELGISLKEARTWATFPLEYADFSDEEMATAAWTENAQRKDLSPMEEARAIQNALRHFGWTQKELGEAWGLASSTISNKKRLLRLPEKLQLLVDDGTLSERKAMALLPLYDLPAVTFGAIEDHHYYGPDRLVQVAANGNSSDWLREQVEEAIKCCTEDFEEDRISGMMDHSFDDDEVQSSECNECPLFFDRRSKLLCGDSTCFKKKRELWAEHRLSQASEELGLPALPEERDWGTVEAFLSDEKEAIARDLLLEEGCDCLHLQFAGERYMHSGYHLDEQGYTDVRVVCYHPGETHCKCLAAAKAARTREENANDDALQEKRAREREVAALTGPANDALATALKGGDPNVWRMVLCCINSNMSGKGADWNLDAVVSRVAKYTLRQQANLRWCRDDPEKTRSRVISTFERFDLPLPWAEAQILDQADAQLKRIEGWIKDTLSSERVAALAQRETTTIQQAIEGNLDNLQNLKEWLTEQAEPCEARSALLDRIADASLDLIEHEMGLYDATETEEQGDG